jgi:hypothetical protein
MRAAWRGVHRVGQVRARQRGAHHRRLALPVDLDEARSHDPQRALDVGGVHRCATVDDGLEALAAFAMGLGMVHQPFDDGGRGEHRKRTSRLGQPEQLRRFDTARGRHDVARAGHQVGNGVNAGAVRHRRGIDDGILRRDRVHVDEIGEPHGHEVAVRQHHALGPAGGAAGVEQPGDVVGGTVHHRNGTSRQQLLVGGGLDIDLALEGFELRWRHVRGHEGPARLRVVDDPLRLAGVQLGIHRHHHQARPPRAKQHLQITWVVALKEHHALARGEAGFVECTRQPCRAILPFAVTRHRRGATEDRGPGGVGARRAREQMGEIHCRDSPFVPRTCGRCTPSSGPLRWQPQGDRPSEGHAFFKHSVSEGIVHWRVDPRIAAMRSPMPVLHRPPP